jgi:hypothetical protein
MYEMSARQAAGSRVELSLVHQWSRRRNCCLAYLGFTPCLSLCRVDHLQGMIVGLNDAERQRPIELAGDAWARVCEEDCIIAIWSVVIIRVHYRVGRSISCKQRT